MQLSSTHFEKHLWGERSELGVQNGPSRRDGKGFLAGKGMEVLPHPLHLAAIPYWAFGSPQTSPFSSFPGWHLLELHLLIIIPEIKPLTMLQEGFGWSFTQFPATQNCIFPPFITAFIFINFEGLFPSFFVPHQQLEVPIELIFLWKKSQKKGKCHHQGLEWFEQPASPAAAVILFNCPFSVLCSQSALTSRAGRAISAFLINQGHNQDGEGAPLLRFHLWRCLFLLGRLEFWGFIYGCAVSPL